MYLKSTIVGCRQEHASFCSVPAPVLILDISCEPWDQTTAIFFTFLSHDQKGVACTYCYPDINVYIIVQIDYVIVSLPL